MVTSSPVKKNIEIKNLDTWNVRDWIKKQDTWNVRDWIKKQVVLNPSATTSLKHCYEAYKNYLEFEKKLVALTKKSFSGLFRDLLQEDENKEKLRNKFVIKNTLYFL